MIYLTRKAHFNAAHKLCNPAWSEERNKEVFGKCANANWHGHNYDLFVTVKGVPDPDTGFVMDAKKLNDLIQREVLEDLDHYNLNEDVAWMKGIMPSTENLCKAIWQRLLPHINNCTLHCIKLQETENIYAEYYGEETR